MTKTARLDLIRKIVAAHNYDGGLFEPTDEDIKDETQFLRVEIPEPDFRQQIFMDLAFEGGRDEV